MDPTIYSLLQYWHEGLWRSIFNQLPFSSAELNRFIPSDRQEIATGRLSVSMPSTQIWIAPFVFEKKEDGKACWIPLWIPAALEGEQIRIRSELALPWIPASQFDETKSYSPFTEPLHAFDDWLRHECLTEENTLVWQSWQVFYQACLVLLDQLSDGTWQDKLAQQGFVLREKAIIADEALLTNIFSQQLTKQPISPVLAQFAQIEDGEPEDIFDTNELLEHAHLLCGASVSEPLSELAYQAVIHALALSPGKFLAIKTPIGDQKLAFFETVVASTLVQERLTTGNFPDIYLLAPNQDIPSISLKIDPQLSKPSLEEIKHAYDNLKQGIFLAKQTQQYFSDPEFDLEEDQSIEEYITTLQARDEKGELALSKALNTQALAREKIRKQSIFKRMLKWVFQRKTTRLANEAIEKKYSDRIRKIKVKRTKIHQTLVKAVDAANTRKNLLRQWDDWLNAQGTRNVNDDLRLIQARLAKELFSMVYQYWQQNAPISSTTTSQDRLFPIKGWSLLKLQMKESLCWEQADIPSHLPFLILDEANRLHPQEVAPLLALSERVLFFGDNQDLPPNSSLSSLLEESNLVKYQLADEELIEQLHYKGLLLSAGNAFTVALSNNSRQQSNYGIYASTLAIEKASPPTFSVVPVVGKSEHIPGNSLMNPIEASAIAQWLKTGPLAEDLAKVLVLTPFSAQKDLLLIQFKNAGISCPVCLFDELSAKVWAHVVFSPVYTPSDRRPFLFDQGEYFLYSALARVSKAFWILGDERIFNVKTHSPSGKLAKLLFEVKVIA